MNFDINLTLAAFGGGVFGAMMGAVPAFIFVGITGIAAVAVIAGGGSDVYLNNVVFGPYFGPHIAFAGGVAAAAYAGNWKKIIPGGGHGADVLTPLVGTGDPGTMIVGGIFGVFGVLFNQLIVSTGLAIDTVALTVASSGILARLIFGKSGLTGHAEFAKADAVGRYGVTGKAVLNDVIIAASLGLLVGYLAIATKVPVVGFVISAATMIFLYTKPGGGPVTHHMTITAGVAALHTGNVYMAVPAAIIAYLFFEFLGNRTLNKYNDTHIDPPAVAIALTTLIVLNLFPKG